jgi:uncharacterized membrane protein
MHGVLVAMGTKLFQLKASCGVATVFFGGVARNAIGALIGIGTALSALKRNYKTDAFCHDLPAFVKSTQFLIIAQEGWVAAGLAR